MDVKAPDLDLVARGEMLYKVYRLKLLAATTLASSCIFFVILMIAQVRISIPEVHHHEDVVKRTRAVQALIDEPSYKYDNGDVSHHVKQLIAKKMSLLIPSKPSSTYVEDHYYDGDEIVGEDDDDEDDDDYDEGVDNDEFENGDFDYNLPLFNNTLKSSQKSQTKELQNAQQVFRIKFVKYAHTNKKLMLSAHRNSEQGLRNVSLINVDGIPIVEDKIFWSKELEEVTPQGIGDEELKIVLKRLRRMSVLKAELPTWDRCGRPKNLFLVLEDGSKACARYRSPHQYLVQGEVLSFYLSRMLGIRNVPAVALANSSYGGHRWSRKGVRAILRQSEWQPNTTVALIQWIDNLERDKMPAILISALVNRTMISGRDARLLTLPVKGLVELLQWSDLVLFDYITGNYDRVASMQDAAEKEKKPSILNETIHNLVRSKTTGGLWLIDNESGLIDSYSLLYSRPGEDSRFSNFHRQMLNSICLFQRTTVEHLTQLHWSGRAAEILMKYVKENEPLFSPIQHYDILAKRMQDRIREVYHHIKKCQSIF